MNWEQMEGKWNQLKGSVKAKWGRLTDNDLDFIAGKRDQLVGKIQERYGIAKEAAEKQVSDWNPVFDSQTAADQRSQRKAG
jgi:uncharacterized protein YjbJ (UPF0337 family)